MAYGNLTEKGPPKRGQNRKTGIVVPCSVAALVALLLGGPVADSVRIIPSTGAACPTGCCVGSVAASHGGCPNGSSMYTCVYTQIGWRRLMIETVGGRGWGALNARALQSSPQALAVPPTGTGGKPRPGPGDLGVPIFPQAVFGCFLPPSLPRSRQNRWRRQGEAPVCACGGGGYRCCRAAPPLPTTSTPPTTTAPSRSPTGRCSCSPGKYYNPVCGRGGETCCSTSYWCGFGRPFSTSGRSWCWHQPSPTANPTTNPTVNPTANPTKAPTANPTMSPTTNHTVGTIDNPMLRVRFGPKESHVDANAAGCPLGHTIIKYLSSRATNPPDLMVIGGIEHPIVAGLEIAIPVGVAHSVVSRDPTSLRVMIAPYDSVTGIPVGPGPCRRASPTEPINGNGRARRGHCPGHAAPPPPPPPTLPPTAPTGPPNACKESDRPADIFTVINTAYSTHTHPGPAGNGVGDYRQGINCRCGTSNAPRCRGHTQDVNPVHLPTNVGARRSTYNFDWPVSEGGCSPDPGLDVHQPRASMYSAYGKDSAPYGQPLTDLGPVAGVYAWTWADDGLEYVLPTSHVDTRATMRVWWCPRWWV